MSDLPFPLSRAADGIGPSAMTSVLKWCTKSDLISFAGGMPDPSLFPIREVTDAAQTIQKTVGPAALQYLPSAGLPVLREAFRGHLKNRGTVVTEDQIVPVCGVQQGLSITCLLLLNQGAEIVVTAPSYFGSLQAFDAWNVKYLSIDLTEQGIDLERLEYLFKNHKPRFFYVIPNFQNPSGITIPDEQRPLIVELCKRYHVPILEDDVFGDLAYGKQLPTLKSFDDEHVIYLTSVSKTISSGFRVGFVAPPKALRDKYLRAKELSDVCVNTYTQHIVAELYRNGTFERLLPLLRRTYAQRSDAIQAALRTYCGDLCSWTRPLGGMFSWLTLHDGTRAEVLLEHASKHGVVFVPGTAFYPPGKGGEHSLRLSYSNLVPEKLDLGIKLLAESIRNVQRCSPGAHR
ncbi:MAG: PLP-dependent aminotransferase family protein [Candidatus Peribacteraceae bacterium]|nr:PLP-dependent aminotransferase family protein [Candidatus Peribacteraceae bacterium]